MATILSGKVVSARIKENLTKEIADLKANGILPGLAVIIVGEDPASKVYVGRKEAMCTELGMHSEKFALPENTTQDQLLELVEKLNNDDKIHGILVQLPLPKHLDEKAVINNIRPEKDVDAFHPVNVGKIMIGDYDFVPCTPAGIMELIAESGVEVEGKTCVVVGRSNIVGKPMSMLLLHKNGTVTTCHSRTKNLAEVVKTADILVAAVGKANFITADMVKPGAVVIDVGMNRLEDGRLVGDVDFEAVEKIAGAITPVPGGVGPMTIAMLMKNTFTAAKNSRNK
ncbi:MAG: bifunctional methylenetetrahydrofolate dehydrogenase/methenyltetrahydrofolate cyclohydrolase FolD [Clostridia bacterium]|nr:bifunctional methylenetetrahydrofolate dehydrogenase/methenyltetrahydrofolate cyclohydrolase FolD [Clostridia bacterium]